MMPEVTESSVSVLSRSERARKGGDGDEKDRASHEEARKAEEGAVEPARQKIAAEEVAADTVAVLRLNRRGLRRPCGQGNRRGGGRCISCRRR
jgi:hypothetical protein